MKSDIDQSAILEINDGLRCSMVSFNFRVDKPTPLRDKITY